MNFEDAMQRLKTWMDESLGQPVTLPSGQTKGLRLTQDYTEDEVEEFEDEWDLDFPDAYRDFLMQVGACELFYGGRGLGRGVSISRLESIPELYHEYFDQADSLLFSRFLPIGAVYALEQVVVIDLDREDDENLALFSDELQATDWLKLADSVSWTSFEDWLVEVVEREGEPPEGAVIPQSRQDTAEDDSDDDTLDDELDDTEAEDDPSENDA